VVALASFEAVEAGFKDLFEVTTRYLMEKMDIQI
jgi:hypothetical protein